MTAQEQQSQAQAQVESAPQSSEPEPQSEPEPRLDSQAKSKRRMSVQTIAECAVAIALISVAAQITVPVGIWKFTLQVLVVMLVALLFKPLPAFAAMAGYILLGAIGLPVFSWAGAPGIARLLGPFGGFLYAYIIAAPVGSIIRRAICPPQNRSSHKGRSVLADVVCLVAVALIIYAVETVHYIAIGMPSAPAAGIVGALMYTTLPYIPAEAFKAVAAFIIAQAVRKALPTFAER